VARLVSQGRFAGTVLDVGCGTGDNTLLIASLGLPVLGVDVAPTAVAMAARKAEERGVGAEFAVADALELVSLGRRFDTVLDSGLCHTFDRDERQRYAASLAEVIEPDGTLYVLCFSDRGPDTGPHPVGEGEVRAAFAPEAGWDVLSVKPELLDTRFHDDGAPAWLATIRRRGAT
jgi:SAM-dependent methyltransferase